MARKTVGKLIASTRAQTHYLKVSTAATEAARADRSFGFHVWSGELAEQARPHTHVDVEGNYLLKGAARYLLAGRFQPLVPGQLALFWGGIPHRIVDVSPGTRMAWITVPIAWFMEWDPGERLVRRLLSGDLVREPQADGPVDDATMLRRWASDLSSGAPALRAAALHEVRARILRLSHAAQIAEPDDAATRATRGHSGQEPGRGGHVERISAFLVAHFRDDITMAQVAAATDLHPNYATSLFKANCGMSPWDYLTRLRVSHAQRLLLTTDQKVTAVALDSGFNSQSNFYEAFAHFVGQTPRAYRTQHRRPS